MVNRIGIISDTHLVGISESFSKRIDLALSSCNLVIHAGDITHMSVLEVFADRNLVAVHGNMCTREVKHRLPESRIFS